MTKMKRANLMPELPWPHEDFARSSSNMLFHTARLTEDNKKKLTARLTVDDDSEDDDIGLRSLMAMMGMMMIMTMAMVKTYFLHGASDSGGSSRGRGRTYPATVQALATRSPA